jgi:glyoxylase-like metal-dependent hydrolase (beta-lactamase superfamily II)
MKIQEFYDPRTYTLTFVVYDEASHDAVVIDPVLDYDPGPSQTSTESVDAVSRFVEREGLKLHYVLETHAHADHLSGSQILKRRHGARVAIGSRITEVQKTFQGLFDLGPEFRADGSQFDRLLDDGENLGAGTLGVRVIATPGHTPACVSYLLGDAVFTGDALFMEDYGTGRCDFPRGSAEDLFESIQKLYALPDATRVFVGHDYQPNDRPLRFETTIGVSKRENVQLKAETSRDAFVSFRRGRDATLAAPRLIFPSVQVNVNAGLLPKPRANGKRYLNVPINLFHPTDDAGAPPAPSRA